MKIFGYWNDKLLPDFIKNSMEQTLKNNPDLEYDVFDNEQARSFLSEHFEPKVIKAFDKLIPWSFKSDLLRFALLYIYGGVWLDLKLILNPIDKEFFLRDYNFAIAMKKVKWLDCPKAETSFLYFREPKNERLLMAIEKIVENCETNSYGPNPLMVTGPGLLGFCLKDLSPTMKFYAEWKLQKKYTREEKIRYFKYTDLKTKTVYIDNCLVDYYANENRKHQNYCNMWKRKKIYN